MPSVAALLKPISKETNRSMKISSHDSGAPVCVSGLVEWMYSLPPKGVVIHLLTEGGASVKGVWRGERGYIAWHPMLKRNKEIERRLGIT